MEEWRDITDYEGLYQVSNLGRVRSLPRRVRMRWGAIRTAPGKILSPGSGDYGHLVVNLSKNNRQKMFGVHRLVASAFLGPCPDGMEVCHQDGDPGNNNADNLRWDNHSNNAKDMIRHRRGNTTKLTEEMVLEIRRLFSAGVSRARLARQFKMTWTGINYVVSGLCWSWVK